MNKVSNPMVDAYLAELGRELEGLPDAVVRDILDGVREELAGLDADQAEVIIEQLGDPAFIAAEARAAAEPLRLKSQREPRGSQRTPWGYVVVAALLVALGGAVIPVLGWIAGIVMVWASDAWRTWEKWVATLAPIATAAVTIVALLGIQGWSVPARYATYQPEPTPMMPFPFAVLKTAILVVLAVNCIAGVWLLWRALRRR